MSPGSRPASPAARPRAAGVRGVVVVDLADRRDVVAVRVEVRGSVRGPERRVVALERPHARRARAAAPRAGSRGSGCTRRPAANARSNAERAGGRGERVEARRERPRPRRRTRADEVGAQVVRDDQHDGRRARVAQRSSSRRAPRAGAAVARRAARRAATRAARARGAAPSAGAGGRSGARPARRANSARWLASASALATTTRRTRRAARPMFSSCSCSRGAGRVRL